MFDNLAQLASNSPFGSPFAVAKCKTTDNSRSVAAADAGDSCEIGSAKYYALCGVGGILSCGITHTAIVPLDLVKCRIQVDPAKYKGIMNGFKVTIAEGGLGALTLGWAPTAMGYSVQGLGKFGFYELFKIVYGNMIGEENAYLYRTSLYLVSSASAEFFADIGLAPFEAIKVGIQTKTGFPQTFRAALPAVLKEEGMWGLYKGLTPLWMRQIPYTMMKFACFEKTVEALYKYVVPKPRDQCNKAEQLGVTFVAGYIPGGSAVGAAKELGMKGLWAGLAPRIIMIGTLTALQWFIYDTVKVVLRLPRPPPPEMPASLKAKLAAQQK